MQTVTSALLLNEDSPGWDGGRSNGYVNGYHDGRDNRVNGDRGYGGRGSSRSDRGSRGGYRGNRGSFNPCKMLAEDWSSVCCSNVGLSELGVCV